MTHAPHPIDLSRNHPPMPAALFDAEYLSAQAAAFGDTPPSEILRGHRWMGTERDRQAGATFAGRRLGVPPASDRVILTNGTQSALLMILSGVVGRGGVLLTEALTYPPILTFARHFGFRVVGVDLDDDGIIPDALERAIDAEAPAALYCVPTFQNPTTSVMSLPRRREIVEIARKRNLPIVEDDIYSLIAEDAPPPLSALAPELGWYILGTAKSIAAGLKVAYVVAPSAEEAAGRFWPGVRGTHWMAPPIGAAVMTAFVENGGADRIITAVGTEVRARQQRAAEILEGIAFTTTAHALHLYFPLPPHIGRDALTSELRRHGIIIGTSDQFVADRRPAPEAVRIGIGNPTNADLLAIALERFREIYLGWDRRASRRDTAQALPM